jgi:uncharacterized protein YutE (UPF0331/DUF86 family)
MARFNERLIADNVQVIRRGLARMRQMASGSREAFLASDDNYAIVEHHLRRSLEALFDLGRHIVVKAGMGNPGTYSEVLALLRDGNVISGEFYERIQGMAGYRNRLVHEYHRVTPDELWQIISEDLEDIEMLLGHLLRFVRSA